MVLVLVQFVCAADSVADPGTSSAMLVRKGCRRGSITTRWLTQKLQSRRQLVYIEGLARCPPIFARFPVCSPAPICPTGHCGLVTIFASCDDAYDGACTPAVQSVHSESLSLSCLRT